VPLGGTRAKRSFLGMNGSNNLGVQVPPDRRFLKQYQKAQAVLGKQCGGKIISKHKKMGSKPFLHNRVNNFPRFVFFCDEVIFG
jgi:hypothetical protein